MLISLLKVCQEWGSRRGVLGGRCGFLTADMEDIVVPDIMNDIFVPQGRYPENFEGRYPENFVLISQLKVCQEGGDLEDIEGS